MSCSWCVGPTTISELSLHPPSNWSTNISPTPLKMPKFRAPNVQSLEAWRAHLLSALAAAASSSSGGQRRHLNQILSHSITSSLWRLDPFTSSRILSSLSSADLPLASLAFAHSHRPSPFAFNSLIRAHSSGPTPSLSLPLLRLMLRSRLHPDRFTLPFLLRSSPSSSPPLHSLSVKHGLDSDPHVATSMLHAYASAGSLDSARQLFDEMPRRTTVTWNALISCFSKQADSHHEQGLRLFRNMLGSCDPPPNADTFVAALSCCAGLGALDHGRRVHGLSLRRLDGMPPELATALIRMYCTCGSLRSGKRAFDATERKDLSTWTSMIGGYAMHGHGHEAVSLFEGMVGAKELMPDALVFTSVLHACSHCGLVEKGIQIFKDMKDEYEVEARVEHYGAVVDLLGRAGRLEEAERVVRSMPLAPNRVVLGSLLHACVVNGEREFGEGLEKELLRLEDGSGFYVGVSNVYAAEGRWDEVGKIRGKMKEKGLRKEGGFSLVEVGGRVHKFLVGDTSCALIGEILILLSGLNKEMAHA